MKNISKIIFSILLFSCALPSYSQTGAIRINQLGYYPASTKIGIVVHTKANTFEVINASDETIVYSGDLSAQEFWKDAGDSIKRCDFSDLTTIGEYKIRIPEFGESYPFEISNTVLRKVAYASLRTFYYQRCSYELTESYAGLWARNSGHPDTLCPMHASTGKEGEMSSPGGWYDAGDFGKYVVNAGISVANLLSFHENFKTSFADSTTIIPESGNGKNDLLDEVKVELDWLKTMQDSDGGVFHKLTTLNFDGFRMPESAQADRYVIGKATASTLDFAAMMAMAARIYKEYDSAYAADCITRADSAWMWAQDNPDIYYTNPPDVSTGQYGTSNLSDEFIWAAAELFISTQDEVYKNYLEENFDLLIYNRAPDWGTVNSLASLSLATQSSSLHDSLTTKIKNSIVSKSDLWLSQIDASPCRIPQFTYNWGSNSGIANIGVGLLYAYLITDDDKYIKGAAECADYLLGKNATGFSFVTKYGYHTPMKIHHRTSGADGISQPVPGFLAGGPNKDRQDGQNYPFTQPAKSYLDVQDSYASNENAINWNAALTSLLAGIDAVLGDDSQIDFTVETIVNNPPVLYVSSPRYGSKYNSAEELLASCTASDPDGITKVELYIDAHYEGTLTSSPFEWSIDNLSEGTHTITFLAFDAESLTSSKTIKFIVEYVSALLKSKSTNTSLVVSPNPFNNFLHVKYQADDFSLLEFEMHDSHGKLIGKQKLENLPDHSGEFDWSFESPLAPGIYFISMLENEHITTVSKLIRAE